MASEKTDAYLPLFGRDFLAATMGWTDAAVGAYIRLLIVQWEQGGLPADLEELAAIAPSSPANWKKLEPKFPVDADGQRRNRRLEEHRAKADALKEFRAAAGRAGGLATQRKRKADSSNASVLLEAKPQAKPQAKTKPPSPSPSSSSLRSEEFTHTAGADAGEEFRRAGWAADEWERFVAVWNRTSRAAPWKPLTPPAGWVDAAANPGWLEKAGEALAALPRCEFFQTPLAVTKFLEDGWVDRIIAGEFNTARRSASGAPAAPPAKTWAERPTWRDDACQNMTDDRYRAWLKSQRPSQEAQALASALKRPPDDIG